MKNIKFLDRDEGRIEVRVMAEAEGWSMVRRKGAMPFIVRTTDLLDYRVDPIDETRRFFIGNLPDGREG